MTRKELVKLEAQLKLLGYNLDSNPLSGTRNWIKAFDRTGANPEASVRYYVWINENTESGIPRIGVQACGRIKTVIDGYDHYVEVSSRERLDPKQMEEKVQNLITLYTPL